MRYAHLLLISTFRMSPWKSIVSQEFECKFRGKVSGSVGNGMEAKTQNFCRNCTEYSRRDFYRSIAKIPVRDNKKNRFEGKKRTNLTQFPCILDSLKYDYTLNNWHTERCLTQNTLQCNVWRKLSTYNCHNTSSTQVERLFRLFFFLVDYPGTRPTSIPDASPP